MNYTVQKREQLASLCRQYHVQRLALFGSALRDDLDAAHNDLDFLVEFKTLPPGTYADAYFDLLEALKQLCKRPVDMVVESAIRNPYFRKSVERSKALLYAAREATEMMTLPNAL